MCAVFGDAGSLKCSVQMGFISLLELPLECSQPIPGLPWKIRNSAWLHCRAGLWWHGTMGEQEVWGAELAPAGSFVKLGTLKRPNRTLVQEERQQKLVNASFLALNHRVELVLSASGFLLLVQEGLPCLLSVTLLCGAAAGHCCILELQAALWEEWNQAGLCQMVPFCSTFCVAALQGVGVYYKKIESAVQGYVTKFLGCLEHSHGTVTWRCSKAVEHHPGPTCQAVGKPFWLHWCTLL